MRFISLFSGMDAASVALKPRGWQCVAFAEIDPAPARVLRYHYPEVPNLGDVTRITDEQIAALGPVDVVIGGSPCQDLSNAGKRAGLSGARSGLFFEQVRIFHAARTLCGARFCWWENVPGAFSSNAGRDFAVVVGTLAGCELGVPPGGWGTSGAAVGEHGLVEWRMLDAQFFGVPQRRNRVFAVLDTGNWFDRPPVLLEPEGMHGDPAPRREAGQRPAPCLSARTQGGGGLGTDFDLDGGLIATAEVASTLDANFGRLQGASGQDMNHGHSHLVAFGGNDTRGPIPVATALRAKGGSGHGDFESETLIAFSCKDHGADAGDTTLTLRAGNGNEIGGVPAMMQGMQVRRLTPLECERLMGVPDNYTLVPVQTFRCSVRSTKKERDLGLFRMRYVERTSFMADGPRYKICGNSMVTHVMAWIGARIERAVEASR